MTKRHLAQETFKSRADYNKLAEIVYAAMKTRLSVSYLQPFSELTYVPYAAEIQFFLNQPEATLEQLWEDYYQSCEGRGFTREDYLSDPDEWELIRGIVKALRHTIKPAFVSY